MSACVSGSASAEAACLRALCLLHSRLRMHKGHVVRSACMVLYTDVMSVLPGNFNESAVIGKVVKRLS